jgi:hypothetical protein
MGTTELRLSGLRLVAKAAHDFQTQEPKAERFERRLLSLCRLIQASGLIEAT